MEQDLFAKPHPLRWWLHIGAVLYYTMGFMVRFAWPPLIPVASADLGIGMSSAGLYMSAFYIGYVISQIPGGMLGDRFGARVVIGAALLLEAAGTFGVGLSPDFWVGFACRVLTGLGAGAVYGSCVRYITVLFPPKERGLAFGLMMMAPAGVGVILPNVLMPWLSAMLTWREAFQVMGVVVFLAAGLAFLLVRDTVEETRQKQSFVSGIALVLRNRNLVFMALAGFWVMWVMVCFVSWSNTYIKSLGHSMEIAGMVMIVYGLAGVAISPIGGAILQKVPSPKKCFILILLVLTPILWLFGQVQSVPLLCVMAGTVGLLLGLLNPIMPLLTSRFAGKELMGTASGVTGCIFQAGAIIGPWLVGMSVDITGSFGVAWIILPAAALAGVLCILPMSDQQQK